MLHLGTAITLSDLRERAARDLTRQLSIFGSPDLSVPLDLAGPPDTLIRFLAACEEAGPGSLTFAVAESYLAAARTSGAAAVIIPPALSIGDIGLPALVTPEPRLVFAVLLGLFSREKRPAPRAGEAFFADRESVIMGPDVLIGPGAYIGAGVRIGRGSVIGAQAWLEDGVEVGDDCLIHPRAIIRWGVRLGNRCQIHSGTVIGEDGFGYTQVPDLSRGRLLHFKNEHLGGVVIEDDVEIGALTAIDRGLVADTVIGRGTKIDNLVQIGHNVKVGRDAVIVAQAGLAGHAAVGDRAFILGQAGVGPGVVIGDDAVLSAQSGLGGGAIPPGRKLWTGTPARPHSEAYQIQALSRTQLPLARKFFSLLKKCGSFEELKRAFFARNKDKI